MVEPVSISACLALGNAILQFTASCIVAGKENVQNVKRLRELTSETTCPLVELERLLCGCGVFSADSDGAKVIAETEQCLRKTKRAVMGWFYRTQFSTKATSGSQSKIRQMTGHTKTILYRGLFVLSGRNQQLHESIDAIDACRERLLRTIMLLPYQLSDILSRLSPIILDAWTSMVNCPDSNTLPFVNYYDNDGLEDLSPFSQSVKNGVCGPYDRHIIVPRGNLGNIRVDSDQWKHHTSWLYHMMNKVPPFLPSPPPLPTMKPKPPLPTGLLRSTGISSSGSPRNMLFAYPSDTCHSPMTLRDALMCKEMALHPLGERVQFARTLVTSVILVHSLGLVHKGISPESIIIFKDDCRPDGQKVLGVPYLSGFEQAREDKGRSGNTRSDVDKQIYVHPDILSRKCFVKSREYQMRDDMFSLGVCLIEIALWTSFFDREVDMQKIEVDNQEGANKEKEDADKKDVVDERKEEALVPSKIYGCIEVKSDDARYRFPDSVYRRKELLEKFAREEIPKALGDGFAEIVLECLSYAPKDETTHTADEGQMEEKLTTESKDDVPRCDEVARQASSVFSEMSKTILGATSKVALVLKKGAISIGAGRIVSSVLNNTSIISSDEAKFVQSGEDVAEAVEESMLDKERRSSGDDEYPTPDSFLSLLTTLHDKQKLKGGSMQTIHFIRNVLRKLECIQM